MKRVFLMICAGMFCLAAQAQLITGGQITTTSTYYTSDSAQLQILTNVPAQLTLDGQSQGEVSSQPYQVRYGQHQVMLTADGYRTVKKNVEVQANALNTYRFTLAPGVKRFPVRKGFQQELVLDFGIGVNEWIEVPGYKGSTSELTFGADYVAGYRFNDWVFLGLGTGLHVYSHSFAPEVSKPDYQIYAYQGYTYVGSRPSGKSFQDRKASVEMPLYAQLKVYFLNTRWKPYFLGSLGGRFGLNEYKDAGVLLNLGLGMECAITERYAMNLSLGYHMRGQKWGYTYRSASGEHVSSYKCTTSCPYFSKNHDHFNVSDETRYEDLIMHGLFVRLGFVF